VLDDLQSTIPAMPIPSPVLLRVLKNERPFAGMGEILAAFAVNPSLTTGSFQLSSVLDLLRSSIPFAIVLELLSVGLWVVCIVGSRLSWIT